MEIISSTGYYKRIETSEAFSSPISLGIYDNAKNYQEISESEYLRLKEEERMRAEEE